MSTPTLDPSLQKFLQGRYIATLATENADGTIQLSAVWYLFQDGFLFVATSSRTRKARNVAARPGATMMIDMRKPGSERGVTAVGKIDVVSGEQCLAVNRRIWGRYLSAAALADPNVGPVFASFDDVTLRLTPNSWTSWDMGMLDAQAFGGRLGKTPGYMLPLD
jgi:PPOX class probable F420-dependent enzyme